MPLSSLKTVGDGLMFSVGPATRRCSTAVLLPLPQSDPDSDQPALMAIGNVYMNAAPSPGVVRTPIVPPCASTIAFAM